jgi:hypothetical protein
MARQTPSIALSTLSELLQNEYITLYSPAGIKPLAPSALSKDTTFLTSNLSPHQGFAVQGNHQGKVEKEVLRLVLIICRSLSGRVLSLALTAGHCHKRCV